MGRASNKIEWLSQWTLRDEVKKCSLLCFSCCATGALTNPHMVEEINNASRPDKNAKQLGLRSMVCNVTMTYSYRQREEA